MPITINGSGTVTGISAGGLPDDSIVTADIANGAVTQAKRSEQLTLGTAQASTSGTSIDFTGIPAWAKRVTVMFQGVSTSGTANMRFQIGAGTVASSGYVGSATNCQNANAINGVVYAGGGFDLTNNGNTVVQHGALRLSNLSGNTWVADGVFSRTGGANGADFTAGYVTLSGALDRIRITTVNGTDTFDAGSINILYE